MSTTAEKLNVLANATKLKEFYTNAQNNDNNTNRA